MINFDKKRGEARPPQPEVGQTGLGAESSALVFDEIRLDDSETGAGPQSDAGRVVNDLTGWGLVALVAVAPIPLASARPVFWMIWSVLALLGLAVYMLAMAIAAPKRPMTIGQIWPVLVPALIMPFAGLVQFALATFGVTTEFAGLTVPFGTLVPDATLMAVLRMAGTIALFILAYEVATRAQRTSAMAWAIFVVVLAHAIWSIIALVMLNDYVFWGEKFAYQGVATGTFVNRNSFASFLGMGLVVGVCLVLAKAHRPHVRHPKGSGMFSEKSIELATLWAMVAIIYVALLLTQSRMGVFSATAAALLAYIVMGLKHHDSPATVLARAAGVLLAASIIGAGGFGLSLLERGVFAASDSTSRTDLYVQVIQMIRDMPLLGTGIDSFAASYEVVQAPPVNSSFTWDLSHSTYLMWWSEAGLVLGVLPIVALGAAAVMLVRIILRRRTNYAIAVIGLAILLLVALHSLIDFSFEIQANAMLFAVLLGLSLGKLRRKAEAE
jgi:O-antigen ligase